MSINAKEHRFLVGDTDMGLEVCTDGSFGLWRDNPASVLGRSLVAAFDHKGLRLHVVPGPGPGQPSWGEYQPNSGLTEFAGGDDWSLKVWGDGSAGLYNTGIHYSLVGSGARFKVVTEQYRPRPEPKPTTTPPIVIPIEIKLPDDEIEKIDNVASALNDLSVEIERYAGNLHDAADAAERLEAVAERAEVRRELSDVLDGAGILDLDYDLDEQGGLERARVRFNAPRSIYVRQINSAGERYGMTMHEVDELEIVE